MAGIRIVILLLFFLSVEAVKAMDISIDGRVVSTPCVMDTDSVFEVDFEQVNLNNLKSMGRSNRRYFTIKMKQCPSTTDKATINFQGDYVSRYPLYYPNAGDAPGVAVGITEADGPEIYFPNGKSLTKEVAADRTVEFPLAAEVFATRNPGTGTIRATVQFSMTYE